MDNNAFLEGWGLSLMVFLPLAGALLMMLIPKAEEPTAVPDPSDDSSTN